VRQRTPRARRRTSTRTLFRAARAFSRSGSSGRSARGREQDGRGRYNRAYRGRKRYFRMRERYRKRQRARQNGRRCRSGAVRAMRRSVFGRIRPRQCRIGTRQRRRIAIGRAEVVESRRRRRRRIRGERCKQVPGQCDQHHSDLETRSHRPALYREFLVMRCPHGPLGRLFQIST
jgi:hypothetical protein